MPVYIENRLDIFDEKKTTAFKRILVCLQRHGSPSPLKKRVCFHAFMSPWTSQHQAPRGHVIWLSRGRGREKVTCRVHEQFPMLDREELLQGLPRLDPFYVLHLGPQNLPTYSQNRDCGTECGAGWKGQGGWYWVASLLCVGHSNGSCEASVRCPEMLHWQWGLMLLEGDR